MRTKTLLIDLRKALTMLLACVLVTTLGACVGSADSGPAAPVVQAGEPAMPAPPPAPTTPPSPATPPFAQLSCSPCTKIVFTTSRDGNAEIYSVNADGTELTRLTNNTIHDDSAAWSPDGNRIAFTSGTGRDQELRVMNADGSDVVHHTLPHGVFDPSWTADGTRITYSALSDGSANIWTVDADGGWPVLLFSLPGWEGQPSWAPDGSKLAVVSDWAAYDFVEDIYLVDPDGAGYAPLTGINIFDQINYLRPSWSPDSTRIGLTLSTRFSRDAYLTHVGVMNRDGSGLTPLILISVSTWDTSKISWSPDGTMIAFASVNAAGTTDVSWVNADGSAWGTMIEGGWNPDWQH